MPSVEPFRVGVAARVLREAPVSVRHPAHGRLCVIPAAGGGGFSAMEDACPHKQARLSDGDIEDIAGQLHVRCPKHRRKFNGGLYFSGSTGQAWCPDSASCSKFRADWCQRLFETFVDDRGDLWIGGELPRGGAPSPPPRPEQPAEGTWSEWRVESVSPAAERSYLYKLRSSGQPPDSAADEWSWHVALRVPGAPVEREYTPVSDRAAWRRGEALLLIKLYEDGALTGRLFGARAGDVWSLTAPRTTLCTPAIRPPDAADVPASRPAPSPAPLPAGTRQLHLLLLAGGTGIAPMWQLLLGALRSPQPFGQPLSIRAALLCSYSSPADALLVRDLQQLEGAGGGRLKLSVTLTRAESAPRDWQGLTGRADPAMVAALRRAAAADGVLPAGSALRCVVSGPQGFNDHCAKLLAQELRVGAEQLCVLDA
eukprot:TRINITY_DN2642_c0_g1_i1.p1 TRINITY_DN2642_c0_g1~~TRINITY_DN2642_c0_g1_i1.p1  ORF type:complete len:455 (+),score=149.59 TRINITY_DN2642_c0_g1_i1:89-1366(+)